MPPKGKCRVCGAPAPGDMPCRMCCGLLLDRDNEGLEMDVRVKAAKELEKREMKNGKMSSLQEGYKLFEYDIYGYSD